MLLACLCVLLDTQVLVGGCLGVNLGHMFKTPSMVASVMPIIVYLVFFECFFVCGNIDSDDFLEAFLGFLFFVGLHE